MDGTVNFIFFALGIIIGITLMNILPNYKISNYEINDAIEKCSNNKGLEYFEYAIFDPKTAQCNNKAIFYIRKNKK